MKTASNPHDELSEARAAEIDAEAEQEKLAAEAERLQERVRDGDEDVTPEALQQAQGLASFWRLRREAAARRREQAERAAFEAEQDRLADDVARYMETRTDSAGKAYDKAVTAVRELLQVLAGQTQQIDALRWRAHNMRLGEVPARGGLTYEPEGGWLGALSLNGRVLDVVDPTHVVQEVVRVAESGAAQSTYEGGPTMRNLLR